MPAVTPRDIYIQPDLRRKRITVTLADSATASPVLLTVEGITGELRTSGGTHTLELPEFKPWTPDAPTLYSLRCNDEPVVQFGMREFSVKDNRFHLNNRPIVLRGVNCDAQVDLNEAWLAGIRKAGFSFVRMRGMSAPEWLLESCDAAGVMVCDVILNPLAPEEHVLARRNHPSIILWSVPSTVPGDVEKVLRAVHDLDPSRVVVGGLDSCDASVKYLRPYHDEFAVLDAVTAHLPAPSTPRGEKYYENTGNPQQTSIMVSFGAVGWNANAPQNDATDDFLAAREMTAGFANAAALSGTVQSVAADTLKSQIQAARVNVKLSGYCVETQGHVPSSGLAAVQTPLLLALRAARTTLVPREEVPVTVTIVNDERIEPLADLSLQVVGPTNQVLWKKKRSLKVPKQTREIWSGTISASGSVGTHKFVVRLMQGMKLLSQNSIDLHVVEPTTAGDVELSVLDPHRQWSSRCLPLGKFSGAKPRVYVLPPLANTVRGYPEIDLLNILAEVRAGAVGLVIGPPRDWNDLARRIDESILATTSPANEAFHFARLHPVFDGLPSRGLMGQPFRNVAPRSAFEENSDESISGAILFGNGDIRWNEDILVRRFDAGRLVFTHLRLLEHLGMDPVADRIFVNMLRHFGRRSVPSEDTLSLPQSVLDWSRRERAERAKLWTVIGPFANWERAGHDAVYPPENNVDLNAVHAGWRDAVRWTRWFALGESTSEFSIDEAVGLPFIGETTTIPETFYAYAEFNAPSRQLAQLALRTAASVKVFANGAPVGEYVAEDESLTHETSVQITVKQGKNGVLIKVSRLSAAAHVNIQLLSATRDPLLLKWWR